MKASNKAIRNAWGWLMILGAATFAAGLYDLVLEPASLKSWVHFIFGTAIAFQFYRNFRRYQILVKQGIEYGTK
ncbi:MAG: hypothetical protein K2K75_10510 [Muribaculaceae bacterium]|nr:hypothetical protein [Muribaculaceae bacterium]